MQISCGTDIIEIERIKKAIQENGEKFIDTIYTQKEKEYCESRNKAKYQHYAVRFAAKEAIYKALSKILKDENNTKWKDVEILNNEEGKPEIKFMKKIQKIKDIDISLSHCKEYAVATVTILYV